MSDKDNLESGSMDLERLLEQKEQLEGIIRDKFTKVVTVVFTDLKGSTSIAERHGDISSRSLIRDHNNIVFPQIKDNNGVLVKSMGDGTLSYFPDAQDAIRAGAGIQREFARYNKEKAMKEPVFIRVGMHTGNIIIEKDDIFGDVVNTASRFESSAQPSEIQLSEETYNALSDKDEVPCRYVGETMLKGKSEPFKVYKAYWDPKQLDEDLKKEALAKDADIAGDTIIVGKAAPPAGVQEPEPGAAIPGSSSMGSGTMLASDDAGILQQAELFERELEFVRLYHLLCKHDSMPAVRALILDMTSEMKKSSPRETKFFGEKAIWHFKPAITTGRLQTADLPLTNKAMSRIPVTISIMDGDGFLRVKTEGAETLNLIEIEDDEGSKKQVHPNREYPLGSNGRVIFSSCFPVEYKVYKNRFMVLRFQAMEECVKSVMNLSLKEVWSNYELETARLIVIGV